MAKLTPVQGGRPSAPHKRPSGKMRRVVFVPQEGGTAFILMDAETFYPLTGSAPVVVTVPEECVGYQDLP